MTQQNHLPTNPIRFAVNTSGKDKDFNYELLARNFKDTTGTIQDIADHVKAGHAICAGLLGNRRRCKANIIGSNLVLIDIDNSDVERDAEGKPIKDSEGKTKKIFKHQLAIAEALKHDFVKNYCSIIYTTASHTPEWEKFRLIFVLPEYTEGADTVEAAIKFLLEQFPHDPACKDASRVFFGSTKAEFPLINPSATLPEDWTARAVEATETKREETEQRLREWEENKARYREYSAEQGWDTDKLIEEALSFIPPRCPGSGNYKECTDVLMALTSHYGTVDAEALAEKWSPSSGKWDIGKKIRSYQSNGIGIGTLFHIAKQYGFRFPTRTTPELPRPSIIRIEPPTDTPVAKPLTSKPPKGIPGDAVEIVYTYSDNQWVVGYQYGEPGLEEIEFRQYHRLPDNSIEIRKGVKPWSAYKLNEAIHAAIARQEKVLPILVLTQNERQVEVARKNGVSAFTFAGKVWSRDEVRAELLKAKKQLGEFVISWISSSEEHTIQDSKKLVLVGSICQELDIKLVVFEADADYELTAVEEVLETNPANNIEEKVIAELEKPAPTKKPTPFSENNQNFIDHSNPDSNIYSIIKALSLDPKNCATFITFESWMYSQKFASGEDWITIDSAYYRWIEAEQIWRHQPDNVVLKLIAEAGSEAYAIKNTKDFSWVATKPYESNAHKEAAFKYNRNRLELPQEYLTKNIHLLAFNNCVVDLRTGEIFPHTKNYYLTNKIPHDYEANKTCPEDFLKFVVDSFGEEFIEVIRAFTSMFLDPTAPYGRFPYLVGQSGGGKGTLLRFWARLFGKEGSGSASNFADISTPEGRHQYLTGKRIFMFPDMGGYTAGLRAFYEIVDNGEMTGRALYNSATYSKAWNVRFGVGSVDYLQIENSGDGFGRRAYVIPVKNRTVIPDQYLAQKLEAVKADVISWALAMPREERDRILLSPPESERAKIATLNAALHADSTRSFVDLCLRPTSETTIVSNALLHELYKAYCKIHGYSPLGMSKFISHLKTILPYNFSERSWNPMVDGVRERTQAHWEYIRIPAEIFRTIRLNTDSEQQYNPEWVCVKSQCQEGGLTEFEDFWNKPPVEIGFNSQQTLEDANDKGVPSSEEPKNTQTPLTENEQTAATEVPSPDDVTYNLSALQDAIATMSWEMILELTVGWTEAMKKAVWSLLSNADKKVVKLLNPNSPKETHNNDAMPPTEPSSYIGKECIVKSGDHAGQRVIIRDYIAEDDEFRAFYKSGDNEYYFGVKFCELTFDIHPEGGATVNAPIVEKIQLQSEVEIVAYGKHKGKTGSVVEVPSSTRTFNPKQYRVSFFDGSERISVWFYEWELKIVEILEEIPGF